MARDGMARRCKIVWAEGGIVHSVMAMPAGDQDGFLRFILTSGAVLQLQKSAIIKIEEA